MDYTLPEIKREKQKLEKDITSKLQNFSSIFGVYITDIHLEIIDVSSTSTKERLLNNVTVSIGI